MGAQTEVKFNPRTYNLRDHGAVLIIGQNPGRQRKGSETGIVWEGNRSGDFITEIMQDFKVENVVLTNISNYQGELTDERVAEGLSDISLICDKLAVRKIICLGSYAYKLLSSVTVLIPMVKLPHPSYVLRFNKDRENYMEQLLTEIKT